MHVLINILDAGIDRSMAPAEVCVCMSPGSEASCDPLQLLQNVTTHNHKYIHIHYELERERGEGESISRKIAHFKKGSSLIVT